MFRSSYCTNCGKYGHGRRMCKDPVTSLGLICIKIEDEDLRILFSQRVKTAWFRDIMSTVSTGNKSLQNAHKYHDKIKFLLIRRKHSIGFLEFVRGKYDIHDFNCISKLFQIMSTDEIKMISSESFDNLWKSVWNSSGKEYQEEYRRAEEKFRCLTSEFKEKNVLGLSYYTNKQTRNWDTPEWGFPKGRRNYSENNMDCAAREFNEETGYTTDDYEILESVNPINEVFKGTNDIVYKHTYFLSTLKASVVDGPVVDDKNNEVGDIGWFTYSEAVKMFRPYHVEKKRVMDRVFRFVVSLLDAEEKND